MSVALPKSEPCCSFCGMSASEVERLIAGPSVFICDQCVALAQMIIDRLRAEGRDEAAAAMAPWFDERHPMNQLTAASCQLSAED